MNKQERITFVINTLKEKYPSIPIPLDHKDPYFVDCGAVIGAMYRCSSQPNYANIVCKS